MEVHGPSLNSLDQLGDPSASAGDIELLMAVSERTASIFRAEFIAIIGIPDAIIIHNLNVYALVELACSVGLCSRNSLMLLLKI
jgi:hypothetical protein